MKSIFAINFIVFVTSTMAWSQCFVADFQFNGHPNDISQNAFQAVVHGAELTTDHTGIDSSAYLFDGVNDYIELNNNEPIIISNEFSVVVWAKMNGEGGGVNNINALFTQRDDATTNGNSKIQFQSTSGVSGLGTAGAISRSGSNVNDFVTASPPIDGEWHCYAFTVDTSNMMKLYIDGILFDQFQSNQVGDFTTSIDHVTIGKVSYVGVDAGFFNGKIGAVKLFNCALNIDAFNSFCELVVNVGEEELLSEAIKMYPNPANEQLTIELPNNFYNYNIEIRSLAGQQILYKRNEKILNISGLPEGFYLVHVFDELSQTHLTKKLIIQK